ncbi:MAG: hypothetical protein GXN93_05345, partial [Candidatus Diapherotrites archaeon]|nr:hypothetical protein [Candidatus Diapherotrites archaeon]
RPVLLIPTEKGVSAIELRSTPAVIPTDVCDDVFVGINARRHLVWWKRGEDRYHEANVVVDAYPVCRENAVYFTSRGYLGAVILSSEFNGLVQVFSSASNFSPLAAFEDLPYFLLVGSDSGNPEFLRNVVPTLRCPSSVYSLDRNLAVTVIPLRASRGDALKWTTPSVSRAESFVRVEPVRVDEDFRCYKP